MTEFVKQKRHKIVTFADMALVNRGAAFTPLQSPKFGCAAKSQARDRSAR
jgi:hypothetical protein